MTTKTSASAQSAPPKMPTGADKQVLDFALSAELSVHDLYLKAINSGMLIHTVSGIGPKIALGVLSGMSITSFRSAVAAGDVKALSSVQGVGRKTAERIVVELRDKLGGFGSVGSVTSPLSGVSAAAGPREDTRGVDAAAALMALGVKPLEAHDSVRAALAILGAEATVEQLIRASLRRNA